MEPEVKEEFGKVRKEMKSEFAKVRKEMRNKFKDVRKEFKAVRKVMNNGFSQCVSKLEFHYAINEIKENMMTKSDYTVLVNMLEQMLPEFQTCQRSNILTGNRLCDMDDKIANHERRIRILEA